MVIPIAPNRSTYPTRNSQTALLARCISVHERLSAVRFGAALAIMSVHQRLRKTALLALPPHTPRPFSPVKARVRKGAKRGGDSGFRLQTSGFRETAKQPGGIEVSNIP
jgi:hypothetical protein